MFCTYITNWEIHPLKSWVNPQFLWQFSIAFCKRLPGRVSKKPRSNNSTVRFPLGSLIPVASILFVSIETKVLLAGLESMFLHVSKAWFFFTRPQLFPFRFLADFSWGSLLVDRNSMQGPLDSTVVGWSHQVRWLSHPAPKRVMVVDTGMIQIERTFLLGHNLLILRYSLDNLDKICWYLNHFWTLICAGCAMYYWYIHIFSV